MGGTGIGLGVDGKGDAIALDSSLALSELRHDMILTSRRVAAGIGMMAVEVGLMAQFSGLSDAIPAGVAGTSSVAYAAVLLPGMVLVLLSWTARGLYRDLPSMVSSAAEYSAARAGLYRQGDQG